MYHLLLTVVALVASFSLSTQATSDCCYPDQMEGIKKITELLTAKYFAADYSLGYIYEAKDPFSDKARIFDLVENVMYEIDNGECNSKPIRFPRLFDRCVYSEDMTSNTVTIGEESNNIPVYNYQYKVDFITVIKTVQPVGERCFPIFAQSQFGRSGVTSQYFDVSAGISHPDPFGALAVCGVEIRTPEDIEAEGEGDTEGEGEDQGEDEGEDEEEGEDEGEDEDEEEGEGESGSEDESEDEE